MNTPNYICYEIVQLTHQYDHSTMLVLPQTSSDALKQLFKPVA